LRGILLAAMPAYAASAAWCCILNCAIKTAYAAAHYSGSGNWTWL